MGKYVDFKSIFKTINQLHLLTMLNLIWKLCNYIKLIFLSVTVFPQHNETFDILIKINKKKSLSRIKRFFFYFLFSVLSLSVHCHKSKARDREVEWVIGKKCHLYARKQYHVLTMFSLTVL